MSDLNVINNGNHPTPKIVPNPSAILITPINPTTTQISSQPLTPIQTRDLWTEFLSLKISIHTQRVYAKAIADFYQRVYQTSVSAQEIAKFLTLPPSEALFQALNYRRMLIEAKLAPSTINVRLSALKSLVDYARKMGECQFSLADVSGLKGETYRDTTGIGVLEFKQTISLPDVSTPKGARDYAILRLLWDNALRRGEICSLDVRDFNPTGRLEIMGKGKIQKTAIDLTVGATAAISHWLALRGSCNTHDPLFMSLSRNQPGHRIDGSSIYRLVRQFTADAGIEKVVSPHRIRHSAITAYLDASDGNIRAAQALSRHSNLNTLTRYDDNRQQYQQKASNILGDLLGEKSAH